MAKTPIKTGTDGTWIFCDQDEKARASNLVLFVHGYGGDADATWLGFPSLMLQGDQGFFERFDIASFGYGSSLLANQEDLESLTGRLRTFLLAYGNRAENVFIICHSLGGLLARRFLVDCHAQPRYRQLFGRVRQVHFIGVPHLGAAPARGVLAALVRAFNPLAWDLRKDSPELADTLTRWRAIVDAATQGGESLPQLFNYVGSRDWVAPMSQVSDGRLEQTEVVETIAGDHISIAKPVTTQNEAYILITRAIRDWVRAHAGEAGSAAVAEPPPATGKSAGTGVVTANRDIIADVVANVVNIYPPAAPGPAEGGGHAGRPLAPRSFYSHPSADVLRLALAQAFGPRPGSVVEVLVAQAGVDAGNVQVEQAANEVWRQVLQAAWDRGRLDALMGLVLKEDRIRGHHEPLRTIWEALRPELASDDVQSGPVAMPVARPPTMSDPVPAQDSTALLSEAASLLESLCPSEGDRRALFLRALGQSAALRRVEWGGSAWAFASNAVHQLWGFGDAEDGQPALRPVLIAAAAELGEPKRSRLLGLARDLWPGR